ncbi:MAG: hypothetical protein K8U03_12120 [Planctomycetia bacterium]|nr:hypothetical protein [Planctomycetia bacterium]
MPLPFAPVPFRTLKERNEPDTEPKHVQIDASQSGREHQPNWPMVLVMVGTPLAFYVLILCLSLNGRFQENRLIVRDQGGIFVVTTSWAAISLGLAWFWYSRSRPLAQPSSAYAQPNQANEPSLGESMAQVVSFGYVAMTALIALIVVSITAIRMNGDKLAGPRPRPTPAVPRAARSEPPKVRFHPQGISEETWKSFETEHGKFSIAMVILENVPSNDRIRQSIERNLTKGMQNRQSKRLDQETLQWLLAIKNLQQFAANVKFTDVKDIDHATRTITLKFNHEKMRRFMEAEDEERGVTAFLRSSKAPQNIELAKNLYDRYGEKSVVFVVFEGLSGAVDTSVIFHSLRKNQSHNRMNWLIYQKSGESVYAPVGDIHALAATFEFAKSTKIDEANHRITIHVDPEKVLRMAELRKDAEAIEAYKMTLRHGSRHIDQDFEDLRRIHGDRHVAIINVANRIAGFGAKPNAVFLWLRKRVPILYSSSLGRQGEQFVVKVDDFKTFTASIDFGRIVSVDESSSTITIDLATKKVNPIDVNGVTKTDRYEAINGDDSLFWDHCRLSKKHGETQVAIVKVGGMPTDDVARTAVREALRDGREAFRVYVLDNNAEMFLVAPIEQFDRYVEGIYFSESISKSGSHVDISLSPASVERLLLKKSK